jgi:hypothetical protein
VNVALALLADAANLSADGKLNILGVFNTIFSDRYPAVHPEMKLVLRLQLHPAELDQPKEVNVQLRNDEGRRIDGFGANFSVQATPGVGLGGEMLTTDSVVSVSNLYLESPGTYEFVILVNGEVKAQVPLKARLRPVA